MNQPKNLQPGDVLLYSTPPSGIWNFIGRGISFFEGLAADPGDNIKYEHAAIVVDPASDQGFETNPPSAHWIRLSEQPWDRIDVYRPTGLKVDQNKLLGFCYARLGQPYSYATIARFLGIGLVGAVSSKAAGWLIRRNEGWHGEVCSTMVDDALEAATGKDIVPQNGQDNVRPSDLASSQYLTLVA